MSSIGETTIHEIQQDLACPECEYNLRGLRGDVVTCPECGTRADVAELVTQRWTRPWYRAPGLNQLMLPVAWLMVSLFTLPFVAAYIDVPGMFVWLCAIPAVWAWLMWRAGGVFHNRGKGLALALLEHVLLVGYIVGVFGLIGFLIGAIAAWNDPITVVLNVIIMTVCGVMIWGCRRGERFSAQCCIREHLRKATRAIQE